MVGFNLARPPRPTLPQTYYCQHEHLAQAFGGLEVGRGSPASRPRVGWCLFSEQKLRAAGLPVLPTHMGRTAVCSASMNERPSTHTRGEHEFSKVCPSYVPGTFYDCSYTCCTNGKRLGHIRGIPQMDEIKKRGVSPSVWCWVVLSVACFCCCCGVHGFLS